MSLVASQRRCSAIQASSFANIWSISFGAICGHVGLAWAAKQQVNGCEHHFGHQQVRRVPLSRERCATAAGWVAIVRHGAAAECCG